MSRQTEKVFREMDAYLAAHQDEIHGDADVERLVTAFMEEHNAAVHSAFGAERNGEMTADDWLEKAEKESSGKKRLECIRKALALEPENLDAVCMEIGEECGKDYELLRERYSAALLRADEIMRRDGWFAQENIGDFWGLPETRPYMRLRFAYFAALIGCGRIGAAIREGREMLRLCENDNMGIRYRLMHLYAMLEDKKSMLALHRRYEQYDETQMLLPLSVVFYKTGEAEKAKEYLLRLFAVTPDTKKFIHRLNRGELDFLDEIAYELGYRPFSTEELAAEFRENAALFAFIPGYFSWADRELSAIKGKTGRKKKG